MNKIMIENTININKFNVGDTVKFNKKFEFYEGVRLNSKCTILIVFKNTFVPQRYGYFTYWVEFNHSKVKTHLYENQLINITATK